MIAFNGPEPFDSVAVILRETREGFGEELRAVAQSLRIRFIYLQAIEEGRFDDLPGHTYAVGFVRTYAEYLGLDGEDMVVRFKDEVRGLERKTELVFPTPVPEGKVPGGAVILLSLLLVALAYGGWFYLSDQGRSVADLIPEVPERLQSLLGSESEVSSPIGEVTPAPAAPGLVGDRAADEDESQGESGATPPPGGLDTGSTVAERAADDPAPPVREQEVAGGGDVTGPITGRPDQSAPDRSGSGEPESAADRDWTEIAAAVPDPVQIAAGGLAEASPAATGAEARPVSEAATTVGSLAEVIARNSAAARQDQPQVRGTPSDPVPTAPNGAAASSATAASEIPQAPSTAQLALTQARSPRVYGSDNQNARIVLRAKYDSWVQVRDGQDALLLTRVLRAGDTYKVPNQAGLMLLTGNAGGLEIEVDGRTLAPLGPVGSVRRNIALDPGRLISGIDAE